MVSVPSAGNSCILQLGFVVDYGCARCACWVTVFDIMMFRIDFEAYRCRLFVGVDWY